MTGIHGAGGVNQAHSTHMTYRSYSSYGTCGVPRLRPGHGTESGDGPDVRCAERAEQDAAGAEHRSADPSSPATASWVLPSAPALGAVVLAGALLVFAAGMAAGSVRRHRSLRRRVAALPARAERSPGRPVWRQWRDPNGSARLRPGRGLRSPRLSDRSAVLRDLAAGCGAAAASVTLLGGAPGWLLAPVAAAAAVRWLRLRTAARVRQAASAGERAVVAQLPLAAELLAACLAAGSGPRKAADEVGAALGGPLGARLARAAAELRLGGEPAAVWRRLGSHPETAGLARALERAQAGGVPAVESMTRLSANLRARRNREEQIRIRRAAVLVTGPLGLCFLPAFLLVGVAPVVIGLARSLL